MNDNMENWISQLLTGFLPEETLTKITAEYETYKDTPLTQLGLDSMSVMGVVMNIESRFGKEIDYETFDIAVLETLASIKSYLGL
jgi:acyl carrier protein